MKLLGGRGHPGSVRCAASPRPALLGPAMTRVFNHSIYASKRQNPKTNRDEDATTAASLEGGEFVYDAKFNSCPVR